jgi:hypothetical protein
MQLIQAAMDYNNNTQVIISEASAKRAVQETMKAYTNGVLVDQWMMLARITSRPKTVTNTPENFELLRNGYLLEYRYYDDNEDLIVWQDVHPLVANCRQFKEALSKISENSL